MANLIGDESDLRNRLFEIMKSDPQTMREYTRRIFFENKCGDGMTLPNFLYDKRKTTFVSLLRIKNFVELNEK